MTALTLLFCLTLAPAAEPGLAGRIETFVQRYVDASLWSGSVLVARHDSVLLARGFGWANVEHRVPNRPDTRYPVASVTKAFTRMATLRLEQNGHLALEDPIATYLPDFPRGDEITIRQLLEHRSGIPDTDDLRWFRCGQRFFHPIGELVDSLAAASLEFEPGTERSYSNGGYTVLARVLEEATRSTFGRILERWLFSPAGMDRSGDLAGAGLVREMADGYMPGPDGSLVRGPHAHPSNKVGAGSAYTTVRDVLAFHRALRDHTLIPPGRNDSAFATIDSPIGPPRLYFGGRGPSYTASIQIFPSEDLLIVALGNNYARLNEEITDGIAGLVFGSWEDERVAAILQRKLPPGATKMPRRAAKVPSSRLRELARRYRHQWGFTFTLVIEDGRLLYVDPEHGTRSAVLPTSRDRFFLPWQWAELSTAGGETTWTWLDFPDRAWSVEAVPE